MKSIRFYAIFLSILSSLFFAVTFVGNRVMSVDGGHWVWSASLRYFWMVPILFIILLLKKQVIPVFKEIHKNPLQWLLWGTVGFGVFYALLTFSSAFGPSWMVASIWQVTIIAGVLLSPFISSNAEKISSRTLLFSGVILAGVFIMQIGHAQSITAKELFLGTVPVLIAAVAYPLGNRKMMQLTGGKLTAMQRLFGMTLSSIPFWLILTFFYSLEGVMPTSSQISQTLIVAVSSGVIATTLFFMATDKVRGDEKTLGAVEASQSTELIFALIGEILLLNTGLPDSFAIAGMLLVIIGMVLHSSNH